MRMAHPLGRLSKRSFITMVAAGLVTVFAYLLLTAPIARAVGDVTWQGSALVYQGDTYIGPLNATGNEGFKLPAGTQFYRHNEPVAQSQTNQQKAHFIYFSPNEDTSKATSAKYVEYIYTPPDTYTQPSNQRDLTVDASTNGTAASSCAVAGGMGWILCPITNNLANGMDFIYGMLADFMKTQPLQITQKDTLFTAWSVIRNIANVIFVIGFIIMIYSQLTSFGLSNYGVKKILPRLIVAAILVNISYYICAIAVDLSNILGTSTHTLLQSLREPMLNQSPGQYLETDFTWSMLATFVLTGGAVAVGTHLALVAAGGTIAAMIYFLVPLLVSLFLTVLVVLLILVARQAIIVCLVIISPLAFVAYLLPGTEKWFERWKDLFVTMLVFFPAFSLIFTGAQLAGMLIIQNATTFYMVIFGLAVQVAPLIVTPLLLKLSGRVLGAVAGIVNNPKRGLVDRTKNWAGARAEMHKQRGLGDGATKRRHILRNYARHHDNRSRYLKERTDNFSGMSDNRYLDSNFHAEQNKLHRQVEEQKEIIEKQLDLKWNAHIKVDTHALEQDLKLRVLSDKVAVDKEELDARYKEFKAGTAPIYGPQTESMSQLIADAQDTTRNLAIEGLRSKNADRVLNRQFAESMIKSQDLQTRAGGIAGPDGADSSLASAIATMRSDYGKSVEEATQIVKHFNLSSEQRQDHAMGRLVTATDSHGNVRVFTDENVYTREAVIEAQVATGTVPQIEEIVANSGGQLAAFRTTISESVAKAGVGSKAFYLGGATINEIAKGTITSEADLVGIIQDNIAKGKIKAETLATMDKDAVESTLKAALNSDTSRMSPKLVGQFNAGREGLRKAASYALEEAELKGKVAENVEPLLERMRDL